MIPDDPRNRPLHPYDDAKLRSKLKKREKLTSVHIIDKFDFYSFHWADREYSLHGAGEQTRQERNGNFIHIFVKAQYLTLSICLCSEPKKNLQCFSDLMDSRILQ